MVYRNTYLDKIRPFYDTPVVKIITGLRRIGKSTLLLQIIEDLKKRAQTEVIYINMESLEFSEIDGAQSLYEYVKKSRPEFSKKKLALCIDEVQQIPNWEKAISSFLADGTADMYLTGSNSSILSSDLATHLSGRYIEFPVYALSYGEYLNFREKEPSEEEFYRYLEFGGLPGIHYFPFRKEIVFQYIRSVYDTVILHDVVERNQLRNVNLLERIVHYLMDTTGNLFSGKNVSGYFRKELRSVSLETVYNYVAYLERAFFLQHVPRFDVQGKKKLEVSGKYYPADWGIKNSLTGYKDTFLSGLLENCVYLDLKRRGYTVYTGKAGEKEVDFIGETEGKRVYIQVTYLIPDDKVLSRELGSLLSIEDNYEKYILSMDRLPASDYKGIKRRYLPDFLLQSEV
ncbi:MAG: ATP-binding protein [Spirochaetia bacterium]